MKFLKDLSLFQLSLIFQGECLKLAFESKGLSIHEIPIQNIPSPKIFLSKEIIINL